MSNWTTLTVSEAQLHDEPRLPEKPHGGNGGSPPLLQGESPCPPDVPSGLRTARLLQEHPARRRSDGVSLVELLNAIMIIGVLAAIALPIVMTASQRAREAAAIAYMRS